MNAQLLMERLNPHPRGSNEALLWAAGLVREARAYCPICQRVFDALCRADDPEKKPVGNLDVNKGRRLTCSVKCDQIETERVMRPSLEAALVRYEEARQSEKRARLEAENKRLQGKLRKVGDL